MDASDVDRAYSALQQQAQQTATQIQQLSNKLAAAAAAGDPNAREWQLDLKEVALAIRDEQGSVANLLQGIHTLVDNHVQQLAPAPQYQPQYQQPQYQPPQYQQQYQPQYQGGYPPSGGMLHRFLGGTFGQAMVTGAGFGIGDDLVNDLFDR